jgi:hydroxyethylthiazole kinase
MPAEGEEMRSPPDVDAVARAARDDMRGPPEPGAIARAAGDVLDRLRAKSPRVHAITNSVAQNFTANVLLALGAQPSMTISPEEIGHFAGSADALLVNLGTFDRERAKAIEIALDAAAIETALEGATHTRLPWVLDPVLIDRSPPRGELARTLIARRPKVVRLNKAEFAALGGSDAAAFASQTGAVVALSGATDIVSDGRRRAAIRNGHPLMGRITAMGCAASAVVTACLAVEDDAFTAACAGLIILGVAGELAGEQSAGPGSFAVAILDALYGLDHAAIASRARVA